MFTYLLIMLVVLVCIHPTYAVYNKGVGFPFETTDAIQRTVIHTLYELIEGIDDDVRYRGTSTIAEQSHEMGDFQVVVRLWLYMDDALDPAGRCLGQPGNRPVQILLGSSMKILMRILLTNYFKATIQNGYTGGYGILGQVGLFFAYRKFRQLDPSTSVQSGPPPLPPYGELPSTSSQSLLPNGFPDHVDCWIYYSSITSGFDDDPFSVLGSGKALSSPNLEYMLSMQHDCNLVLYEDDGSEPVWSSGTQNAGTGCYLKAQVDGNLVIYSEGPEGDVWSIRRTCGPFCIISTSFTLQDDRNFVGYYTSSGKPFFASGTNI